MPSAGKGFSGTLTWEESLAELSASHYALLQFSFNFDVVMKGHKESI